MIDRTSRARLLSLLSQACELEHALSCSYLYAAFSLKTEIEDGVDWRAQQRLRRWASQVYHVAAEEMLHLAQAWNILTAVGGSPYYGRPNFPQPARHFPLNVSLQLRRFDAATLERFTYYENPAHERADIPDAEMPVGAAWPIDESFDFRSVGELYGECARIIGELDESALFLRDHDVQIGRSLVDFNDLIEVVDRRTALQAIEMITEQGEGNAASREDSHFNVFVRVAQEIHDIEASELSRPVADNPFVRMRRDQIPPSLATRLPGCAIRAFELTDETAILATDLFDDCYALMMQSLAFVFSNSTHDERSLKPFARIAIEMMVTVIKPLGEAITYMPSGTEGVNAGPTFAMTRHVQFPPPVAVARRVMGERLWQLSINARILAERTVSLTPIAQAKMVSAATNLRRLAEVVPSPA